MSRAAQRLLLLSTLILLLFGLHTLRSVWEEKESAVGKLSRLQGEAERQRGVNALLQEKLEPAMQQSELERIAREQLFLVYPDEKIFFDMGN